MVKGMPRGNYKKAADFLDSLVIKAVRFLEDSPEDIKEEQPKKEELMEWYSRELTDFLREADLISKDCVAVASRTPEYGLSVYQLCIYNLNFFEHEEFGFFNADVFINRLKYPKEVTYKVSAAHPLVFFEEEHGWIEGNVVDTGAYLISSKGRIDLK